jgi:hypothetical protein
MTASRLMIAPCLWNDKSAIDYNTNPINVVIRSRPVASPETEIAMSAPASWGRPGKCRFREGFLCPEQTKKSISTCTNPDVVALISKLATMIACWFQTKVHAYE